MIGWVRVRVRCQHALGWCETEEDARFLQDVIEAVTPEVAWESQISSGRVIVQRCSEVVLWESSLVSADVVVSWWYA